MKPSATDCMGGLLGVVLALGVSLPGARAAQPTGKPAPFFATKTRDGNLFALQTLHGEEKEIKAPIRTVLAEGLPAERSAQ